MYAVVDLQGHQYIVAEGMELVVDNLGIAQSEKFVADKVLAVFDEAGKEVKVGKPTVAGASVEFEVGETRKGEKVKVLKFKRKTRYARLKGFRPLQTVLIVKKIAA
ncbi:MAG: 50S ribosomal protein L21 [bacterium]|nr:50S ribosomal protein L21 [bacterium]